MSIGEVSKIQEFRGDTGKLGFGKFGLFNSGFLRQIRGAVICLRLLTGNFGGEWLGN